MEKQYSPEARMLNVVVLHWEDSASLGRCLGHLNASRYPYLRVIVVENGSSRDERAAAGRIVERCRPWFRKLLLLQLEQNVGYAGGNNAAISYLNQGQYDGDVCILNPDVCVDEQTLSVMMAALTPDVGLVMCRAMSEAGVVLYDGIKLSGYRQRQFVSSQNVVDTDYAQGACFIVRRTLAGGAIFDERFFLYWEEVDLALRVRAAGGRIISATTARIVRHRNDTGRLANALYYSARNGLLMLEKYPEQFSVIGYIVYWASLLVIALKLLGEPRTFVSAVAGLYDAVSDARASRYGKRSVPAAQRHGGSREEMGVLTRMPKRG